MNALDFTKLAQQPNNAELAFGLPGQWLILTFGFLVMVGFWQVFKRVDEPGWKGLIPVYNIVVLLGKVGRPTWWTLLFFVPLVNVVVAFVLSRDVAAQFDRTAGVALGLLFISFIFATLLGIGS
jgi:hypothetical protein